MAEQEMRYLHDHGLEHDPNNYTFNSHPMLDEDELDTLLELSEWPFDYKLGTIVLTLPVDGETHLTSTDVDAFINSFKIASKMPVGVVRRMLAMVADREATSILDPDNIPPPNGRLRFKIGDKVIGYEY